MAWKVNKTLLHIGLIRLLHKAGSKGSGMEQTTLKVMAQVRRETNALDRDRACYGDVQAQFALANCLMTGHGVAQDIAQALHWYLEAAAQRHTESQYIVAGMYRDGIHVAKDNATAIDWYLRAIESGHQMARFALGKLFASMQAPHFLVAAHALFRLACDAQLVQAYAAKEEVAAQMSVKQQYAAQHPYDELAIHTMFADTLRAYMRSDETEGVRAYLRGDYAGATQRLREDADHGSVMALYLLSRLYADGGHGIERDIVHSLQLLEEAAAKGDIDAQYALAEKYRDGIDLVQSNELAWQWLQRAAAGGHVDAQYAMFRLDVAPEDFERNFAWLQKAADNGGLEAQYMLGFVYAHGIVGVEENNEESHKWLVKAAFSGYPIAQYTLAQWYAEGQGVAQSQAEAFYWHSKAAKQGYAASQFVIGTMYDYGLHVAQSDTDALHWYTLAANQEDVFALFNLGVMYHDGQGVRANYRTALSFFMRAARQHSCAATRNVGMMYFHGRGCRRDPEVAFLLCTLAAGQGEEGAMACLPQIMQALTAERIRVLNGVVAQITSFEQVCGLLDELIGLEQMGVLQCLWHRLCLKKK